MLEAILPELADADNQTKIKAYITGIWAAQYLNSIQQVQRYRDLLVSLANSEAFSKNLAPILSALTTQYWRNNQFLLAKQFGLCTLQNIDTRKRIVSVLITMSIAMRRLLLVQESIDVSEFSLVLAKEIKHQRYIASINNNAGVFELSRKNYRMAEKYFSEALDIRHQIAHLSGQVGAGTNLLLTYFFLQDWEKFERLSLRIERLQKLQNSKIMLAYYNWVSTAFQFRHFDTLTDARHAELLILFEEVEDSGIRLFLKQAADAKGWIMPEVLVETHDDERNMDIRRYFPMCEWENIAKILDDKIIEQFEQAKITVTALDTP